MDPSGDDGSSMGGDSTENSSCDETLTGQQWYSNPVFNHYWKSYNLAMGWFGYHQQLQSRTDSKPSSQGHPFGRQMPQGFCSNTAFGTQMPQGFSNTAFGSQMPQGFSNNTGPFMSMASGNPFQASGSESQSSQPQSRSKQSKRKKRKMSNSKKAQLRSRRNSNARTNSEGGDEDPMFEMEITPEMREFFAKSAQHRRERAAEREDSTGSDYIDLTEVTMNTKRMTVAAPTERPGMRRTEQMKLLYGSGAAMIHGMETALQLNFDRNFDIKTPKLWPHLPLNITFHS